MDPNKMNNLEKDKKELKVLDELLDEAINEVLQDTSEKFDFKIDPNAEPDYGYYGHIESRDNFNIGRKNNQEAPQGPPYTDPRINQATSYQGPSSSETYTTTNNYQHAKGHDAYQGYGTPPTNHMGKQKIFEGPFTGQDTKANYQTFSLMDQFKNLERQKQEYKNDNSYSNEQAVQQKQTYQDPSVQQAFYNRQHARRPKTQNTFSSPPQREPEEFQEYRRTSNQFEDLRTKSEPSIQNEMKEKFPKELDLQTYQAPERKRIIFNNDYFQNNVTAKPQRKTESFANDNKENNYQQQRPKFSEVREPPLRRRSDEIPEKQPDQKEPEFFEYEGKKCTTTDPGGTILSPTFVHRSAWGALPSMKPMTPMTAPAETVVLSLNTETPMCLDAKDCMRKVKEIQARHMGRDLGDIQYNFLVGGNGVLYEGRGWTYESGVKRAEGEGPNLNIAFIGNFSENPSNIPAEMITPVHDLVMWANVNKLITGNSVRQELEPPKKPT